MVDTHSTLWYPGEEPSVYLKSAMEALTPCSGNIFELVPSFKGPSSWAHFGEHLVA